MSTRKCALSPSKTDLVLSQALGAGAAAVDADQRISLAGLVVVKAAVEHRNVAGRFLKSGHDSIRSCGRSVSERGVRGQTCAHPISHRAVIGLRVVGSRMRFRFTRCRTSHHAASGPSARRVSAVNSRQCRSAAASLRWVRHAWSRHVAARLHTPRYDASRRRRLARERGAPPSPEDSLCPPPRRRRRARPASAAPEQVRSSWSELDAVAHPMETRRVAATRSG